MNKKITILILLVSIIVGVLTSCTLGGDTLMGNEDKAADARFEQVVEGLKNKDKDVLKAMFSKQALTEAIDFESRIDNLFESIQGSIESWERTGLSGSDSTRDGKTSTMVRSHYKLVTDKEEYYFFIVEYTKDASNPDNIGVYMLQVAKYADMPNLPSWQDSLCAGIWEPKE